MFIFLVLAGSFLAGGLHGMVIALVVLVVGFKVLSVTRGWVGNLTAQSAKRRRRKVEAVEIARELQVRKEYWGTR